MNARVDFFGIATLAVGGSLNSAGDVDFRMDGYVVLDLEGLVFEISAASNGAYAQDTCKNDLT